MASSVGGSWRPSFCVRLSTLENLAGVIANLSILIRKAGPITHQAAGYGEFAKRIYRWYRLTCRQGHELITPGYEKSIRANDKAVDFGSGQNCEGFVDASFSAGIQHTNLSAKRTRCFLSSFHGGFRIWIVRVNEKSNRCFGWDKLVQHSQLFA